MSPPGALVETMLALDGRVPWLDRHLDRLGSSARALGFTRPERSVLASTVAAALGGAPGRARVRLVLPAGGAAVTEVTPEPEPEWRGARAVTVRGAWDRDCARAQHKALPREGWDRAQATAVAAGADHALLLDARGALGEAALANAFAVTGGRVVTAPARGLLAGVARGVLVERMAVTEAVLAEDDWRGADELFLTNAVRGVIPVTEVDGRSVGAGRPGPVATRALEELRASLGSP